MYNLTYLFTEGLDSFFHKPNICIDVTSIEYDYYPLANNHVGYDRLNVESK